MIFICIEIHTLSLLDLFLNSFMSPNSSKPKAKKKKNNKNHQKWFQWSSIHLADVPIDLTGVPIERCGPTLCEEGFVLRFYCTLLGTLASERPAGWGGVEPSPVRRAHPVSHTYTADYTKTVTVGEKKRQKLVAWGGPEFGSRDYYFSLTTLRPLCFLSRGGEGRGNERTWMSTFSDWLTPESTEMIIYTPWADAFGERGTTSRAAVCRDLNLPPPRPP